MIQPFRLNKRDAKLLGVCAGIADLSGVDLLLVRIATVLAVIALPDAWGVAAYLVAGVCAPARTS